MSHVSIQYYKTTYGELILGAYDNQLCLCDWRYRKMRASIDARIQKHLDANYLEESHPVISRTIEELTEYFAGKRKAFDVPMLFAGSEFQRSVWNALIQVSYGETSTYQKLSDSLGNSKAIRAVAAANGANAISILVPCHRIIGSDGSLVGYAGGLQTKQKLLELEQSLLI
ncbi:MAG: methylated-DNA--[protein]-cysteine S-methyltransferase [Opitutales bacterium]|nr:methylated-DNA--[protein]-cysteine S-methyltransferase [Opitutales bacterium]